MKTRAFTLIELLGVIVILGILGIVILPKVGDSISNSKEQSYKVQEETIKKAANDFLIENTDLLENNATITIKLGTLKQKGYLPINIKNPKTKKNISNESLITVKKTGNVYDIQLALRDLENVTENIDNNSPILVLNGDYIEYVEVNETYIEKGATAKTSIGETIDNVSIQIKQNDIEKSSVDTSQLLTYNVIYSATDTNGNITSATRTVIVRDTKAPTITFPIDTTLHTSELADYDLMQGVSITDNYDSNPTITLNSSVSNIPGKYVVTYKATDSEGNEKTERRIVRIDDKFDKYYTRLDYIGLTGTQYINTGVIPNPNTKVEMDFDATNPARWIFGSRLANQNSDTFGVFINSTTEYWVQVGSGEGNFTLSFTSTLGRHKIYVTNSNFTRDTSNREFTANNTPGSYNMYIGIMNSGGTLDNRIFTGKIYSFKVWNNDELIRDFVPYHRNRDKVAGLYDIVNNKFYTNDGTGEFTKGEL